VTTAAVVLAAGSGSRFAGAEPKLLAPFRGQPLASWALAAAVAAGLDEVFVVTGGVDLAEVSRAAGATVVANPRHAEGQSTSVLAGLDAAEEAGHDAVVIGLADQPLVPAEAWRRVGAERSTPIAVAIYEGQRRNPVRLASAVWPAVRRDLRGDEGARRLLGRWPDLVTEVTCPGNPADIDTLEDLSRWS
jgi:molybdenum cofactor cytidylyltransferase